MMQLFYIAISEGLFNVRLPPLGYQTLRLIPLPNHSTVNLLRPAPLSTEPITVDNKFYVLTFDPVTGEGLKEAVLGISSLIYNVGIVYFLQYDESYVSFGNLFDLECNLKEGSELRTTDEWTFPVFLNGLNV